MDRYMKRLIFLVLILIPQFALAVGNKQIKVMSYNICKDDSCIGTKWNSRKKNIADLIDDDQKPELFGLQEMDNHLDDDSNSANLKVAEFFYTLMDDEPYEVCGLEGQGQKFVVPIGFSTNKFSPNWAPLNGKWCWGSDYRPDDEYVDANGNSTVFWYNETEYPNGRNMLRGVNFADLIDQWGNKFLVINAHAYRMGGTCDGIPCSEEYRKNNATHRYYYNAFIRKVANEYHDNGYNILFLGDMNVDYDEGDGSNTHDDKSYTRGQLIENTANPMFDYYQESWVLEWFVDGALNSSPDISGPALINTRDISEFSHFEPVTTSSSRSIDYIFFNWQADNQVTSPIVDYKVLSGAPVDSYSDHRPVIANLKYNNLSNTTWQQQLTAVMVPVHFIVLQ
jgi:endonuclease/exonuclease/phosphatase family metal-dependent hydrolase